MAASEQIPQTAIDRALDLLARLEPAPLAIRWEYQDNASTVLFLVNLEDQTEASVMSVYFPQVAAALGAVIPGTSALPKWMVVFQDSTGHLITSCTAQDNGAPSNNSFKPNPLRGSA